MGSKILLKNFFIFLSFYFILLHISYFVFNFYLIFL